MITLTLYICQKAVVCISILLQSTNSHCNYLQSVLEILFHSTCMPEKVVEVLTHWPLSIIVIHLKCCDVDVFQDFKPN
ncbi:hypothetical protein EDB19DRAFT_1643486 [Suillus lakei]|nr:hypothetical protein EDB19DRAFT_1643486 [Suillus lakei]